MVLKLDFFIYKEIKYINGFLKNKPECIFKYSFWGVGGLNINIDMKFYKILNPLLSLIIAIFMQKYVKCQRLLRIVCLKAKHFKLKEKVN